MVTFFDDLELTCNVILFSFVILWYLDLHVERDRRKLIEYCRVWRPIDIWTSPPCALEQ